MKREKNLAKLNNRAAELALQRSSFFPALDFLGIEMDSLGEEPRRNHYDLMMKNGYCDAANGVMLWTSLN